MAEQGPIVIVCTDQGRHPRRVLDRVAVGPSPKGHPTVFTVVPKDVDTSEAVRRVEAVTFRGRRGYGRRWACPTCGRDVRRQDSDLIGPLTELMRSGVSELDISA